MKIRRKETFADRALRMKKHPEAPEWLVNLISVLFLLLIAGGLVCGGYSFATVRVKASVASVTKAPSPNLPSSLAINGESWGLRPYKFGGGEWNDTAGATECQRRVIWYDFSKEPVPYQKTILWHEIFHAAHCRGYESDKAWWTKYAVGSPEHPEVYKLGMFMPVFVHDNPEFMRWAEDWK